MAMRVTVTSWAICLQQLPTSSSSLIFQRASPPSPNKHAPNLPSSSTPEKRQEQTRRLRRKSTTIASRNKTQRSLILLKNRSLAIQASLDVQVSPSSGTWPASRPRSKKRRRKLYRCPRGSPSALSAWTITRMTSSMTSAALSLASCARVKAVINWMIEGVEASRWQQRRSLRVVSGR